MIRSFFCYFAATIFVSMLSLVSASAYADDGDTEDYRVHIMKTMGEQAAAIELIIEERAPADALATHVQILLTVSSTALKSFEPKVVGGETKPEVWTNWPDFARRMNELTSNLQTIANSLTSAGPVAAIPKIKSMLACGGCHEIYSARPDKALVLTSTLPKGADKDAIAYRQHIMSTLNEQSEALGQILATTIPADNAVAHMQTIALAAGAALKSFKVKALGGEANPTVWEHWEEFTKRMNDFSTKTAAAATNAQQHGFASATADIDKTLNCKDCHDIYRTPDTN
jgi:cytochrome c556